MIFNTMQEHAKALIEAGETGSECLILERVGIDFEGMDEAWKKAQNNLRSTKFDVPVIFFGRQKRCNISRFPGKGRAIATYPTFKTKEKEWNKYSKEHNRSDLFSPENPYPIEWFPWMTGEIQFYYENWRTLLQAVCDADAESLTNLFGKDGQLLTFNFAEQELINNIRQAVCLPVSAKTPRGMVHATLAYNALSILHHNRPIDVEALRFCLLYWILEYAPPISLSESQRKIKPVAQTVSGGNLGSIDSCWIAIRVDTDPQAIVGLAVADSGNQEHHPVFQKFVEMIGEDQIDNVRLGGIDYTAPETGKSPTNAYLNTKNENALTPDVRRGFDKTEIMPLVEGFDALIRGTRFSLSGVIGYYVFPENTDNFVEYISIIRNFLSQLADFRNRYFNELKKSSSNEKAREKKKQALDELLELRRKIWANVWHNWPVSEWIFAFEENVGSANQQQNTWTAVYRHLPVVRTYLLLYIVDDPTLFGQLIQMLKATAHNLGEEWVCKEVKRMLGSFFAKNIPAFRDCWLRWRGYLVRTNVYEDSIKPELWERALAAIMHIKAIDSTSCNEQMKGLELIKALNKRSETMIENNRKQILSYLTALFPATAPNDSEDGKAEQSKTETFLADRAADFARFVDVESPGWQYVVDGLICGWALKQICRKLRGEDYASAIGGRSLAKQSPAEVRALMVKLAEKAIRAGSRPWNIDTPTEILFKWSQRNAYTAEATLFMDALSLGFMRYDRHSALKTQNPSSKGE